jgi:pimeloyl-ACP methyl ester carboxylesterase
VRRVVASLGGLLAAFALMVVVGPSVYSPIGQRAPIDESPRDYGLRYEDVAFAPRDRAITLRGWWISAEHPRAAIVVGHGGGDNRSVPYAHALALVRDLAARGYGALMFDFRNYGESDGTPEGVTYGDLEANDIVGAVDFLATRAPDLPAVALGFSMGGATVLRAAARDGRLRAVVADSAFAEAADVAAPFTGAMSGLPSLLVVPFVWSARYLHGLPLARGSTVGEVRGAAMPPVLLIQDEHDTIVPLAQTRRLAAAIPGATTWAPALAWSSPFGTHCMAYRLAPEEYVARVSAFFAAALAARGERDAARAVAAEPARE